MKNKRLLSMLLCLCMVVSLFVGFNSTEASADGFTNGGYTYEYTVKSNGTSLSSICNAIGLPYDYCKQAIYVLNGWDSSKNVSSLAAGTNVILPNGVGVASLVTSGSIKVTTTTGTSTTTTSTVSGLKSGDYIAYYLIPHTVLSNETLYSICNDLGVSYNTYATLICNMSGITNTRSVKAGSVVYVPVLTAPSSGSYYCVVAHKVLSSETAISICNSYNVNYYNFYTVLEGLNSQINLNYVKAGQTMYLPVPSGSVTPTVAPTATVTPTVTPTATPVSGYAINFNNEGSGSTYCVVGTSTKATSAQAGDTVTIYPEPTAKYAVHAITVTRDDSKAYVTVTNNSFTMPASSVTINVLFEKGDYTLNCLTPTYGTFDVYVGGAVADAADYGDAVSVSVTPDAGYVVDAVVYQKSDGKIAAVSVTDDNDDGIYEFLMPNYNVNISVSFKKAIQKNISYKVTYSGAQTLVGSTTAVFEYSGQKLSGGAAPVGGIIYMTVSPEATKSVDEVVVPGSTVYSLGNNVYYFKMPNAETAVEIKLTDAYGEERAIHTLTEIDHSSTSFVTLSVENAETGDTNTWAQTARVGDKVVIVEYPLAGWTYVSSEAVYSDGSAKVNILNDGKNDYFIMPDYDVTVTCNFVQDGVDKYGIIKYTSATLQSNSWQFRCYDSNGVEKNCFTPGEKVKIEAVPDSGYSIKSLKAHYQGWVWWWGYYDWTETLKAGSDGMYDFTMPSSNVTLELTFGNANTFAQTTLDVMKLSDSKAHGDAYLQVNGHNLQYNENELGVASAVYKEYIVSDVGTGSSLEVVTLPEAGYQVDTVKVRSAGWFGLTATKTIKANDEGRYFYTVNKNDAKTGITFEVTYKLIDRSTMTKYAVQYAFSEYGMYDIVINEGEGTAKGETTYSGEAGKAVAGDYVTLVVKPAEGYDYESIIIDGEVREAVPGASGQYTYTFQMPSHDVATEVTYVKENYTLINAGTGTIDSSNKFVPASTMTSAPFTFQVASAQNAKTAQYKDVVQVVPTSVGSQEIKAVYYRFHNQTDWTAAYDNTAKDGTFTFTMSQPYDVEVRCVLATKEYTVKAGTYSAPVTGIQFKDGDNWKLELTGDTTNTNAGAKVKAGATITYSLALADDYASYDKLSVLVNGVETEIDLSSAAIIKTDDGKYWYEGTFTMPAQDTVVSVVPSAAVKNVVKAYDQSVADLFQSLTAEGNKFAYGSTVEETISNLPTDAIVGVITYSEDGGSTWDTLYQYGTEVGEESEVEGASYDPVTRTVKFAMPANDVTLNVTLYRPITFKYDESLGYMYYNGKLVESGDVIYAYNTEPVGAITATVKSSDKYKLGAIKVTASDGSDIAFASDAFTMTNKAVTVSAEFVQNANKMITVTIPETEEHAAWSATVNGNSVGSSSKFSGNFYANEGDVVVLTIVTDSGYQLVDDKTYDATDHPRALVFDGISNASEKVGTGRVSIDPMTYRYTFYVQGSDINIHNIVTNTVSKLYTISLAPSAAGTVRFFYDEACTSEIPSAGITADATVYAKITVNANYQYVTALNPLFYTDATNINKPLSDLGGTPVEGTYDTVYKFTMPANNITVILNVELKTNSIVVNGSAYGTVKFVDENGAAVDTSKVKVETKVYPVINSINDGYVLKYCEVKWTDTEGSHDLYVGPNCKDKYFTMPAVSVMVTPVFEEPLKIKGLKGTADYDISVSVDGTAIDPLTESIDVLYDQEVKITFTAKDTKTFKAGGIQANGEDLANFGTWNHDSSSPDTYTYTFNMPNKNMTITATMN